MPIYMLTFCKEVDVSVEAESKEALKKAAEAVKGNLDRYWDTGDWDITVYQVEPIKGRTVQPECKLVNGEILEYEYEEALKEEPVP